MSLTPEQVMATHKGNVETLFGLANKAFDGLEKMVELNLSTSRAALTDASTQMQSLLSAKDPQELLTLQTTMLQPLAEKIASYNRQMYEIASATSAEFTKALEAQTADAQKAFTNLIDSTAKNAPAGSETAVAVMKSAVSAATNAFESMQKAVKQATDMAQANISAVAETAADAAKSAAPRKR
jgi:phasin family protein